MTRVVLDSEAFNALSGPRSQRGREVLRLLTAAQRTGSEVYVPTVVLAELYRPGRSAKVDSVLSHRDGAPICRDTDRELARMVGAVLGTAGAGSEDIVDAHVVATAAESGRAVIATGDPDDLERLAVPYPLVTVVGL